jgi:hypothetical protein
MDEQGQYLSYKEYPSIQGWTALNYANQRILWKHTNNSISLWRLDAQSNHLSYKEYGPYAGWIPLNYEN